MINSKSDLKYYLECDRIALKKNYSKPKLVHDVIWKYQIIMRKTEYYQNCGKGLYSRLCEKWYKFRLVCLGQKLGFSIGLNTCGPGLALVHYGLIVIHQNARLGENCRVHEGVTIGTNASGDKAPQIGNNVYISSGVKVIGDISVADDVVIGANAVVVKDVNESGITVAGVPAKKVSNHTSDNYLVKATAIIERD